MSIARREKVLTLLRENGTVMLKELGKAFSRSFKYDPAKRP